MSWLDRIKNQELEIITGDGSVFKPIWKTASRSRVLNPSKFEPNNVEGSLVKRGKVSSVVIPFELWFQGENNIEQGDLFDEATKDTRPWTLKHPFYDELLVHPASLNLNNNNFNVTIATGEFWETIEDTFPDSTIDLKEDVLSSIDNLNENVSENYSDKVGVPDADSISTINKTTGLIADIQRAAAKTSEDIENAENAIAEVESALDEITTNANVFMTKTANLARTPSRFYSNIKTRISTITESYNNLKLSVTGLASFQNKLYFEAFGAALIGALAECSVVLTGDIAEDQGIEDSTITDYDSRIDVLNIIDTINETVNDFIDTLGDYQSENDSDIDSFTPQPETIQGVRDTATKAMGQLNQIAVNAKQERKYVLPESMPILKLVHRLYGVIDNTTIDNFINANKISIPETILIKKDREVIYYI